MQPRSLEVRAFFSDPDRYLRGNFNIVARAMIVKDLLGDICHSRIIDVGCGDGSISAQFLAQDNSVTMVDLSSRMLERARARTPQEYAARVDYVNSDLADFDAQHEYDVVLCIGVLAHVECVEKTIAKVAELLRVGGRCVIQITDSETIVGKLQHRYYSVRSLLSSSMRYRLNQTTLLQVNSIASRASLKLLSVRRHALLLPGMAKLPNSWLLKYDLFVLRNPILSKQGASALILFEKTA